MAAGLTALPGVRRPRTATRQRAVRRPGWVVATAWLAILLGSLVMVTWRQTRGIGLEDEVREVQGQQAVLETERLELIRRIEVLRSRARVVSVARDSLGMHLPSNDEIVFLSAPSVLSEPVVEARE